MHKIPVLSVAIISSLFLTGCNSTPKVFLSTHRLENPEVASKPLKVNISSGIVTDSIVTVQETDDEPSDGNDLNLMANIGMTFAKGLQFSLTRSHETYRLSGKYQFWGENSDKATKGNFSQAISLGYIRRDVEEEEGNPELDGKNLSQVPVEERSSTWQHRTNTIDIAWVLGYRLSHNFMIYGGPFYSSSALNGVRYKGYTEYEKDLDLHGYMTGANLALEYRFDNGLALISEVLIFDNKWESDTYSYSGDAFNFKIDYQF